MASEERKKADQAIEEQNLHNSLGAEEQQAETDAFQCGKCKQRKTRYRQAQTRSADEPMTVRFSLNIACCLLFTYNSCFNVPCYYVQTFVTYVTYMIIQY